MLPLVHSVKPFPRGEALGCVHFSSEVGSVRDPPLGAPPTLKLNAELDVGPRAPPTLKLSAELDVGPRAPPD